MVIKCNADLKKISNKNIYIYGAKSVAVQVYNVLKNQNTHIQSFLVTEPGKNPEKIDSTPVQCIYDVFDNRHNIDGCPWGFAAI